MLLLMSDSPTAQSGNGGWSGGGVVVDGWMILKANSGGRPI